MGIIYLRICDNQRRIAAASAASTFDAVAAASTFAATFLKSCALDEKAGPSYGLRKPHSHLHSPHPPLSNADWLCACAYSSREAWHFLLVFDSYGKARLYAITNKEMKYNYILLYLFGFYWVFEL